MTEKPIIFSTEMVRAIIEGRKTQTRRVIKGYGNIWYIGKLLGDWSLSQPPYMEDGMLHWGLQVDVDERRTFFIKPPYQPGDVLWVRETWAPETKQGVPTGGYVYRASDSPEPDEDVLLKWKPSIFMPREAARIFLKVTNVRVERLQEITEEDALREGMLARDHFPGYWDKLNAKRGYGWYKNPWVWVIEFDKQE